MNIFSLLSYINKVSLLAFFVTTLVVAYQIYIIKKEKTKEKAPSIPDFKDIDKSNEVVNYTRLHGSLIKKNNEPANYSKLVFLIISLLTIMVVIFVFILIKKNSSLRNEASVSPTVVVLRTPTLKPTCTGQACLTTPTKTPAVTLSPSLTPTPFPTGVPSPTVSLLPSPTAVLLTSPTTGQVNLSPTVAPTEIILAQALSLTPTISLTNTSPTREIINSRPQTLPETGRIGKGLLIIGVAISTIFFSFWF